MWALAKEGAFKAGRNGKEGGGDWEFHKKAIHTLFAKYNTFLPD